MYLQISAASWEPYLVVSPGNDKLEELFSAALTRRHGPERDAFLESACGDDVALRKDVTKLLGAHERVGSFLESSPVGSDSTIGITAAREETGTRIGRYKLLQEIGEGGFGTVHLAEQEEPVRRQVALKIIKLGMDTKQVIARFEAERQALALMDHINIARVFDAGATDTGRPYFVMELVRGPTITEYCDQHQLSIPERIELFLPICHAVQHAHQKGIIHRDLKPNNVLVTLRDGKPTPKVIDFGIAKATTQRLTDKTLFTEFRQFLGTPEYMSPDQVETSGLDIDTRADIYSLGIVLYELLTGTTPLGSTRLREASYEDLRRIIREDEPAKPSTRVQSMDAGEDAKTIAQHRRLEPASLSRSLRGDLDWVVMKAVEKDRNRRYQTASDLAADLKRHLADEPVVAGPPGAGYKFRKFVRRHRAGVVVGVIVAVALLAGLSLATVGFIQSSRSQIALGLERDAAEAARTHAQEQRALAETSASEARTQAGIATTVSEFLRGMLASVDPSTSLGREVSVRYILDEAARKIDDGALAQQPEVEAAIRMTLGETYEALGLYAIAEEQVLSAKNVRSRLLGPEHADTLRSMRCLAGLLRVRGRFVDAESMLRETLDTQRRVLGGDHRDTLTTMNELALALWGPGRFEEAESIHRAVLKLQRRVLGPDHPETLESMGSLGAVCRALGKTDEAERLLTETLSECRRLVGNEHPTTTKAMDNLGLVAEELHDYDRAETLFRGAYEADRRILGPDHPRTSVPMNNLLRVLRIQGKIEQTAPIVAQRLDHLRRQADRPDATPSTLHACAWELLTCQPDDLRDSATALPYAVRAVEEGSGSNATYLSTLAMAYHGIGQIDLAVKTQQKAIQAARVGGLYDRSAMDAKLVDYIWASGDLAGASEVLWEGLRGSGLAASLFPDFEPGASFVSRSEAFMEEGRYADAAATLQGCLALRQKELPEGHWLIAETTSRLGAAKAGEERFEEAELLVLDGFSGMAQDSLTPQDRKADALERIIQLYDSWNKPQQASHWRERLDIAPAAEDDGG